MRPGRNPIYPHYFRHLGHCSCTVWLPQVGNTLELKALHIKQYLRSRCFEFSVQMSSLDAATVWLGKPCSYVTALLACDWEYMLQQMVLGKGCSALSLSGQSAHVCTLVLAQNNSVIFLRVCCSWHLFWKLHIYICHDRSTSLPFMREIHSYFFSPCPVGLQTDI